MPKKILIVEDDFDIASFERDYLEAAKFKVEIVDNGPEALKKIRSGEIDLVILDLMLPGMDGNEICRRLREFSDIPVVMVTAKGETGDMIDGLGLGSDDYTTKPFDPTVLVARVKAHLESYRRHKGASSEIEFGDIRILVDEMKVFKGKTELKMPNKEFELLKFLAENAGKAFSKEDIFEAVWGLDSLANEATVTVHVNRLREKIEKDAAHPKIIKTVWGVGYRLEI